MDTLSKAGASRKKISELADELERTRNELRRIETACKHSWSKPEYIPEYHEGYTSPGDPPGTMGVDRRLPTYIPAETVKRWQRKCSLCGKVETTERTNKVCIEEPRF